MQVAAFRNKRQAVYSSLRTAILVEDLLPGSRLVIDELAKQLGVSQNPVREALQQLQADGLITFEPYVGATVTDVNADSAREIFDLLEAFELVSGRAACERMSDQDLDEMQGMLQDLDGLADDLDRWLVGNARLHDFVCAKAGTTLVGLLMAKVLDHWERLRRHYLKSAPSRGIGIGQEGHWLLLEAVIRIASNR
jgi:DNA-binding GntR family transcriptional regulator